jgi:hypothetical protein
MEILGGALWSPDERDYLIEDIVGAAEYNFPESYKIDVLESNQNAQKETYYACTCYSTYHAVQGIQKVLEGINLELDYLGGFAKQKTYGTFKEGVGDYVRTAFKSVKENGVIVKDGTKVEVEGYALVGNGQTVDHEKIKHFISQGNALVTTYAIQEGDTSKSTGYLTPLDTKVKFLHAVAITGYTKDYAIISNSLGDKWGKWKDGTFRVKWEHLNLLKGIYILYLKPKVNMIFDDVSEASPHASSIKFVKEQGLMTGSNNKFRPEETLTRRELAIVIERLYKLLKT